MLRKKTHSKAKPNDTILDIAQIDIQVYAKGCDIRTIRVIPSGPFRAELGERIVFEIVGIERTTTEGR